MSNHIRKIIVTGGAGTLGSEVVRKLLDKKWVEKILVLSRDEAKHEALMRSLGDQFTNVSKKVECRVCDIRDLEALIDIFQGYDGIIHTAALKRVTNGESNPEQYIATNIVGTSNVLKACRYCNITHGVFISTDKAVAPINLYGCSKQIGEKMWRRFQMTFPERKFSIVRYGNVMGSSGSIVDLWERQPREEHRVNDKVTRFWISVEEAATLCMYALDKMMGGEVFIEPNMALSLIELYKSIYGEDSEPELYEKMMSGEKCHEVLLDGNESGSIVKIGSRYIHIPEQFPETAKHWKEKDENRLFLSASSALLKYQLNSFQYGVADDLPT